MLFLRLHQVPKFYHNFFILGRGSVPNEDWNSHTSHIMTNPLTKTKYLSDSSVHHFIYNRYQYFTLNKDYNQEHHL